MSKERKIGIAIGLFLASVLFVIAATAAKQTIETDLFLDYDLMVAQDVYKGASQSSDTNALWIDTDTGNAPTGRTSAASANTIVFSSTNGFICVSNNWIASGVHWGRFIVDTNW